MPLIVKNQSEGNLIIYVSQSKSIEVPINSQIDLLESFTRREIAFSDVPYHIQEGNIILNDGDKDLSILNALRVAMDAPTEDAMKDSSGKLLVHETSRVLDTITYFTGTGDDPNDVTDVGGGAEFIFSHSLGDPTIQHLYLDFNIIQNKTYLHEGYMIWENADFDTITFEMVPRVTTVQAASNTNYDLYGGYLIVPASDGTGSIEITSDITSPIGGLVYMPDSDTGSPPTAYWNADWNSVTKKFENITPAAGNGRYNMFAAEIVFARFVNKIPVVGNGFKRLQSADSDQLGHGMRLKSTIITYGEDHTWKIACILTMHREKTC